MIDITGDGYLVVLGPGDADSGRACSFTDTDENAATTAMLLARKNGGQPVRVYRVELVSEVVIPLGNPEWKRAG